MRVVADLQDLERGRPTILTIGSFDGVHRGHQYLIGEVMDRARAQDAASAVITFDPIPQVVLRPGSLQLTDGEDKARLIGAIGPDVLAILPFTSELSLVPADEFLQRILERVNLAEVWVGADFAFGHRRSGNVAFLIESGQDFSFAVHVVARRRQDDAPVSSTRIRTLADEGNVAETSRLLGHPLSVEGPVVRGESRGAGLGFPTANVLPSRFQQLPRLGIYAGYIRIGDERLPAAISVGYNVVFGGRDVKVEAYVLDYAGDLRDQVVGLEFIAWIREERNFETVEALIEEMGRDVERVRRVLQ